MTDLHTRLTAAITARLDVARAAAATPRGGANWTRVGDDEYGWSNAVEAVGGETVVYDEGRPSEAESIHIASWDPSTAIRVLEALQEELNEHTSYDSRPKCCGCGGEYPCRTVQRWARALGVEVE